MSDDDYIVLAKKKYPKLFKAEKLVIKPAAIEAMIRKAFNDGYNAGKSSQSLMEKLLG